MTAPDTATAETKVRHAIELYDDAEGMFPSIAGSVRRLIPAILTLEFGHPICPKLVDELLEALVEQDNAEPGADWRYWSDRVSDLTYDVIHGRRDAAKVEAS